jgi:hypothetical protein
MMIYFVLVAPTRPLSGRNLTGTKARSTLTADQSSPPNTNLFVTFYGGHWTLALPPCIDLVLPVPSVGLAIGDHFQQVCNPQPIFDYASACCH